MTARGSANARGEFRAVPALLWESPGWQLLSPDARLVWLALKGRCGPCGIAALAALEYVLMEWTGLSVEGVQRALMELEAGAAPWIRRERQVVVVVGGIDSEPSRHSNDLKHRTAAQRHLASLPRLAIVRRFVADHPVWFPQKECGAAGLAWVFGDAPLEDAGGPPQAPSKTLPSPFEDPSKHGVTEDVNEVTKDGNEVTEGLASPPPHPTPTTRIEAIRGALPPAFRPAFEDALAARRKAGPLLDELEALHDGARGTSFSWEVIGQALHELAVAEKPTSALLLRAFCERLVRQAAAVGAPSSAAGAQARARHLWRVAQEFRLLSAAPDILERIDEAARAAPEADRESLKADLLAVKIWELGSEREERFALKRIEERLGDAAPAPAPADHPHFAKADCDRLHEVWGAEMGVVDYARFRKAFGRLFPESPPYSVDEVALAIKEACGIAQYQGGFALRTLTPETFVDRVSYWVDLTRRPMLIDGIATERGKLWGLAA